MKILVVVLILSLCPAVTLAQGNAGLPTPATPGAGEPASRDDLPDLTNLPVDWWSYFDASGKALHQRIWRMIAYADQVPARVAPEVKEQAQSVVRRIRSNLLALPSAREQRSVAPQVPDAFQGRYKIAEFLDLHRRLRDQEIELRAARSKLAAEEAGLNALSSRVDTLTASYLGLDPMADARVLKGLEIVAGRSELALGRERQRVARSAIAAQVAAKQRLEREIEVAGARLVAQHRDFASLTAALAGAEDRVEGAGEWTYLTRAKAAHARSTSLRTGDRKDLATVYLREQQAVQAEVEEATAQARLDRLRLERLLVLLLVEVGTIDLEAMRERIGEIERRLADIAHQTGLWAAASRRERDLAAAAMGRGAGDEALLRLHRERLRLAQNTAIQIQRLQESVSLAEAMVGPALARIARREGWLSVWASELRERAARLWGSASQWADASLFKLGDVPVTSRGIGQLVLIVLVFWFVARWLKRSLLGLSTKRDGMSHSALYTVGSLSQYAIVTVGILVGLGSIGIDFTNLALVAGAIGIGVGFGLQSIVANFVSGLILLFERSLKVGDFVELASGVSGEVRAINVRSTVINTNDNVDIVVPNLQFVTSDVINWTLHEDYRRIHVPFRVAHGTDKERVKHAALCAAEKLEHTLKTKRAGVWLSDFDDNGLEFELVVWVTPTAVKRPGAVNAAYRWEIESELREHGIEIPVPQRDLRLRSDLKSFLRELLEQAA